MLFSCYFLQFQRLPLYVPGRCPENHYLWPGNQPTDWVCDCAPGTYKPHLNCLRRCCATDKEGSKLIQTNRFAFICCRLYLLSAERWLFPRVQERSLRERTTFNIEKNESNSGMCGQSLRRRFRKVSEFRFSKQNYVVVVLADTTTNATNWTSRAVLANRSNTVAVFLA